MAIYRIIVVPQKTRRPDVFKIINLEIGGQEPNLSVLYDIFANPVTMRIVHRMPKKPFKEVMYNNAVIDPEQQTIIDLCSHRGIKVEAAKVSYRYCGKKMEGLYTNKLVHTTFISEPKLTTLKPRGVRQPMQYYDLIAMNDGELIDLSNVRDLHLSLEKMKKLAELQKRLGLDKVNDVFLETFAASWSEHCYHDLWRCLGLFKILKEATERIGNPNLLEAFVGNAGSWDFYDGLAILFKLETHNSPSKLDPYCGQLTKLGGVIRDIIENGLGAKPIGNLELTVIGELVRKLYPQLVGKTLPEGRIGLETIRAIADYGNPMGIPMLLARMMSHPKFSGKPFALGGTFGITTKEAAKRGTPHCGDLAVLVGGKTGNDGLHGATVSSGGITESTDTGDLTHVQIGLPYIEQKMMRAGTELRDAGCCSCRNDFGAAGIVSAFGEIGKLTDGIGGLLINLALVSLKCVGLSNWQIALSESQERFAHAIKPEKLAEAMAIYEKYGLEATVVGNFTNSGRFQMIYDPVVTDFKLDTPLSGEVCLDIPYDFLDECPLTEIEVVEPEPKPDNITPLKINYKNVMRMGLKVVGHFDVCGQSWATTRYDSTVQGICVQGPLYGRNYNVASHLAAEKPVYGKRYGMTVSFIFSPWQFEADPVQAALNAMMDALVTQVIAGVNRRDICLADNFYTDGEDPVARWYLREQVKAIIGDLSVRTGTPYIVGKDSSAGRGTFGGTTVSVPPCVAITGMGKIPDVNQLILHQWKKSGNALVALGPTATRLDGSILFSSLGITGVKLDNLVPADPARYLDCLYELSRSGMICSAVPINRGGMFLRLFEGVEASGFGVDTNLCEELFTENFGGVLVEVKKEATSKLFRTFPEIHPVLVGTITTEKKMVVQGKRLNWSKLHDAWSTSFKKALLRSLKEEMSV